MMAEPLFLNVAEVAELFGRDSAGKLRLSTRGVYRHWKTIPGAVRLGKKLLFRRGPLMAWVDDIRQGTVIPFARSA
jgi:hypothetical protein